MVNLLSRTFLDMSSKTAEDLIAMGSTLLALTPNEILSIANETFLDAVAEISEIQGFSSEQLQAWASKATAVRETLNDKFAPRLDSNNLKQAWLLLQGCPNKTGTVMIQQYSYNLVL